MKKILVLTLTLLSSFCADAKLFRGGSSKPKGAKGATGATGPQGATGATGPQGIPGKLSKRYVSAATNTLQRLYFPNAGSVAFETNVISPVRITHPVEDSHARFKVRKSGVYLISWSVNLEWEASARNVVATDLFNETLNSSLYSAHQTFDAASGSGRNETVTGQVLVYLESDDVISLRLKPSVGTMSVTGGLFSMIGVNN